jgi:drug/metabolite transporter (DMT)-like permease
MALQAILLLIVSAGIHSVWNLLSKRSRDQQVFLWLALVVVTGLFLVPFILLYAPISGPGWAIIGVSGLLEAGYFTLLGQAYRRGDLSTAYPLIRGTAILTATTIAFAVLGEGLAPGGLAGVALVLAGMYTLHLRDFTRRGLAAPFLSLTQAPSQLALFTGAATGTAAVIDKIGVRYVNPVLYIYLIFTFAGVLLAPYMLTARRAAALREWRANRGAIIAVGVMFIVAYLLVLYALQGSKVSYVSAVREMSVVFAALLGTRFLHEPFGGRRILGACLIFAGILAIALAR